MPGGKATPRTKIYQTTEVVNESDNENNNENYKHGRTITEMWTYLQNLKHNKNMPISQFKETKIPVWCHGNRTKVTRSLPNHDAKLATLNWCGQPKGNLKTNIQ